MILLGIMGVGAFRSVRQRELEPTVNLPATLVKLIPFGQKVLVLDRFPPPAVPVPERSARREA